MTTGAPRAVRTIGDDRGAPRRAEAMMRDFAGGIKKLVDAARESAKQQQDTHRRQEADEVGRQQQNSRRASELLEPIWDRIRDAERAGDGTITVDRTSGITRTTFELLWQESQPERTLRIAVDETDGVIQASWIMAPGYRYAVDGPSVVASRFDLAQLEAAIELLFDQSRWARGAIPRIPW